MQRNGGPLADVSNDGRRSSRMSLTALAGSRPIEANTSRRIGARSSGYDASVDRRLRLGSEGVELDVRPVAIQRPCLREDEIRGAVQRSSTFACSTPPPPLAPG